MSAGGTAPVVVDGLRHFYGEGALRHEVLAGVSLSVARGEIVMVSGPSGSGKSTLLSLIGGLRSPQQGSIRIFGEELAEASARTLARVRRGIGFVFQSHGLLAPLSARENVEMALLLADPPLRAAERRRRATELLAAVGLESSKDRLPSSLSEGQRQRVALARALAAEPDVLLADEPTAALDKQSGRDAVELVDRLARDRGCAVILVTHDYRIVDVADRHLRLEDGRLTLATDEHRAA